LCNKEGHTSSTQRVLQNNNSAHNEVYTSEWKDALDDASLCDRVRNTIWKDAGPNEVIRQAGEVVFYSLRARDFFIPLEQSVKLDEYWTVLPQVKSEFQKLAVDNNIEIQPVFEAGSAKSANSNTVYLVNHYGTKCETTIGFKDKTGNTILGNDGNPRLQQYGTSQFNSGTSATKVKLEDGKMVVYTEATFLSYLGGKNRQPLDRFKICTSLYCEPLHRALIGGKKRILEQMVTIIPKTNPKTGQLEHEYKDFKHVMAVGTVVDEAVVHGLNHYWMLENATSLGLEVGEVKRRIEEDYRTFQYGGSEVILDLCKEKSPKEIIQMYLTDPQKVWELIKGKKPQYKGNFEKI